jgi:hypothetical protein
MSARRAPRPRADNARLLDVGLRVVQAVLALWLLAVPVVLPGPNPLVAAKDVVVGGLLLTVTVAAAASGSTARRIESATCLVLGALLILASVLLEFGPATAAPARQWSEVVVGVLLVCVGAARAR